MSFDAAWRSFVEREARRTAPATLEARVHRALSRREEPARRSHGHALAVAAVSLAAALVLLVGWQGADPKPAALVSQPVAQNTPLPPLKPPVMPLAPLIDTVPRVAPAQRRVANSSIRATQYADLLHVVQYGEVLQIVRFRVPREALESLGLILLDPDAQGVVDVDVVVGEDGLPRDIRPVRTLQEH